MIWFYKLAIISKSSSHLMNAKREKKLSKVNSKGQFPQKKVPWKKKVFVIFGDILLMENQRKTFRHFFLSKLYKLSLSHSSTLYTHTHTNKHTHTHARTRICTHRHTHILDCTWEPCTLTLTYTILHFLSYSDFRKSWKSKFVILSWKAV